MRGLVTPGHERVEAREEPRRNRDSGPADSRHQRECLGAADCQRFRERQVDGQQSARALALGEPQDAATDDEHQRHEPNFPEALLNGVVEKDAEDQGGHRGDGDQPGQPPIRIALERSVADRRQPGRDEPQPVGSEVDEERDQCPDMEHHAEGERCDERIVPSGEVRNDDQVTGRRDRQELGESLHDPHDDGLRERVHVSGCRAETRVRPLPDE